MNTILSVISGELHNQSSRFVFPSEAASSLWAQKICGLLGIRSVAQNRFLAWDRFKEGIIRSEVQDREPVSAVLRKLFAGDLVKRNAEAVRRGGGDASGETEAALPFRVLIPPAFAEDGAVFVPRIAGILPSLKLLGARLEAAGTACGLDDEDRDFTALEKEYAAFLEKRKLFEPSWERPPLKDREHRYYIFFPEAVEDFAEYEGMLKDEPTIRLIHPEKPDPPPFVPFNSSRAEIRSTVLEIRRLHEEEGVPYEDMAVSVPDLESLEPYLLREMSLYSIPPRRRSGRPLGDYGTGKLFSLAGSCVSNNFSFTSLKSLLLNERLPWSQPSLNKALVKFGILNNCVSAYRDKGRQMDVWLEAFRTASREERLRRYYLELKTVLSSMTGARTFKDIRKYYFAFRGKWTKESGAAGFLSRDACTDEGDAALARCIEELSALIQIEEKYPDLTPPSPFQFFLGVLREKKYVPVQEKAGVNIFPYRVAAAAPYTCHFVLNASQNAATVLYQPLKFLRQDKRKRLGIAAEDADVSASFFRLYRLGSWKTFTPYLRISASEQTFSGWAIPHSVFFESSPPADAPAIADGNTAVLPSSQSGAGDFFRQEQIWWTSGGNFSSGAANAPFPSRLFSVQKSGFENWRTVLNLRKQEPYSFLNYPFPRDTAAASLLENRISAKQRVACETEEEQSLIRASATTDLNVFFFCPAKWLCQKIFETGDLVLEAQLMDDASLGLLYHGILRDLFARIREEDRVFRKGRLADYNAWIEEITFSAAGNYPAFQGPLAVPLVISQAAAIARRLKALLKTESLYFDGYAAADLETPLHLVQDGVLLNGILDRVSVSPEDKPLIVDYKTGTPPTKAESSGTDDSPLRDFQMPMYVKLYEAKTGVPVETACFLSINNHDVTAIIGSPGKKRGHAREAYQETLEVFDGCTRRFAEALNTLDFAPPETDWKACSECDYRRLCRTTFTLNAKPFRKNTKNNEAGGTSHVR
ncbi:MAG: PD-(D/E)XK nuclease family protein [Treponema sp.]|nr:PD-(D/E)XK nuclease family protein [Treponema sp.]